MSYHRQEPLIYNGDKIPVGGVPGDVLMKAAGANYYTSWQDLTHIFQEYDVVLDDGEF
jgi:thiamine biosynthesis protein ThiC